MARLFISILEALFILTLGSFAEAGSLPFPGDTDIERVFNKGAPKDLDDLLASLKKDKPGLDQFYVEIPHGRSLQKDKTDFIHPRLAGAITQKSFPQQTARPATFFGFAHNAAQAEIIAWNERLGRYEFYVIENMNNGRTPKLTIPSRGVCLSCHQNEGPILSRAPWREIGNSFPPGSTAETEMAKALANYRQKTTKLQESQPELNLDLDTLVRKSNQALAKRELCEKFCDESDHACRARFLAAAIEAGQNHTKFGTQQLIGFNEGFNFFETYKSKLRDFNVDRISSVLPDRDPMKAEGGTTTIYSLENGDPALTKNHMYTDLNSGFDENQIKGFNQGTIATKIIQGIKEEADPSFPRPKVPLLLLGSSLMQVIPEDMAFICFGLDYADLKKLPQTGLYQTIFESPLRKKLFEAWPPSRDELNALFEYDEAKFEEARCLRSPNTINSLTPIQNVIDAVNAAPLSPATLFQRHCAECHDEFGSLITGIRLPLDDPDGMKAYTSRKDHEKDVVSKRLMDKRMPPKGARFPLSDSDRNALIKYLR